MKSYPWSAYIRSVQVGVKCWDSLAYYFHVFIPFDSFHFISLNLRGEGKAQILCLSLWNVIWFSFVFVGETFSISFTVSTKKMKMMEHKDTRTCFLYNVFGVFCVNAKGLEKMDNMLPEAIKKLGNEEPFSCVKRLKRVEVCVCMGVV